VTGEHRFLGLFTTGETYTLGRTTSATNAFVTRTNLVPIVSSSGLSNNQFNLARTSSPARLDLDYVSLFGCAPAAGLGWYAGSHSLNNGNNGKGWIFADNSFKPSGLGFLFPV
jgi:hypothetical protein